MLAVPGEGWKMRKVVVTENVTLDGVIQAPGRTDEDARGGFTEGGWARRYDDPAERAAMGRAANLFTALRLGRLVAAVGQVHGPAAVA
jgi:hypothetical protein